MIKTIFLAGGCFWGIQHLFSLVPGVINTQTGFANSVIENPTYREVCSGATGAAETVKVEYDSEKVSLEQLLGLYLEAIDPSSLNRQGNDVGTQYRTGIYYVDDDSGNVATMVLKQYASGYSAPVVVQVMPLENFYPAEEYHQDYLDKNPGGYCHVDASLFRKARTLGNVGKRYERPDDRVLRERLTPLQWMVTQNAATERPYDNEYYREFAPGIYVDVTTGEPLFVSTDKYESGCGWPAFTRPISPELISESLDTTHGMRRTEVRSAHSGAHLGHVFPDGPASEGGMRYCINSASLRFVPLERMEEEGYGDYVKLVK